MFDSDAIHRAVSKISPASVASYLVRLGYELYGEHESLARIYRSQSGQAIVVPWNQQSPSYGDRMFEVISLLTDESTSVDDVLGLIALPDTDIIRHRVEGMESIWGQVGLGYLNEATQGMFGILKYSAAGVRSARTDYRGIPELAKQFAKSCRFGQTEFGSFIFKVFCPSNPLGIRSTDGSEPFGRTTVRAAIENLKFLASGESEDPDQILPPAMNKQVANAVVKLKPESDFSRAEIRVRFSETVPIEIAQPKPKIVTAEAFDLGPFIYSRAQRLRQQLTKAEEFGRELFSGFIVQLHKDRPTIEHQSHKIAVDVKFGASRRMVYLRLMPADYKQAVMWHDRNLEVRLDAVIDKRARQWRVAQLHDLSPLKQDNEQTLFDV